MTRSIRAWSALAVVGALLVAYGVVWRPWFMRWGATADEIRGYLPGDELVPDPGSQSTRAITIDAPVDAVWPWLAQLGQDRGGFYSYEVLEDLVGTHMTNANRILPAHQDWKPGDSLWMYPPGKMNNAGAAPLRVYEKEHVLAFATRHLSTPLTQPPDGVWTFVLERIDSTHTRFLARGRGTHVSLGWRVFDRLVFDPIHFVMEKKMMKGIAARAEGRHVSSYVGDTAVVLTWVATIVLAIVSLISMFRRARWERSLACFAASGFTFQVLTLVQPGLVVSLLLVVGLAVVIARRAPPDVGSQQCAISSCSV